MTAVVKAIKDRIGDFKRCREEAPQKPILGYCYALAVMGILGLIDVCRPVHCPLGHEIVKWPYYPSSLCVAQLMAACDAIRGDLRTVTFPAGLEVHNGPAASFASGHLTVQGFVLAGLAQIVHGIATRYLPPRLPILLLLEMLDFGDEFQLLLGLAEQHAKGELQLQAIIFGHHSVKDPARYPKFHEVRQRMMALCPGVPVLAGLPVGHERPNCVVPLGWGTARCDPNTGQTSITYARNESHNGAPSYVMLPDPKAASEAAASPSVADTNGINYPTAGVQVHTSDNT